MRPNLNIGERIKALRDLHGMSQWNLAAAMEVFPQQVSQWEAGAHLPNTEKIVDLAHALSTTPNVLLGFEDVPHASKAAKAAVA